LEQRHNFGQWESFRGTIVDHPKDVSFVREFCWGTYGLGAKS